MNLSKPQYDIINDVHRFKAVCAGRRWGKTHFALIEAFIKATNKNRSLIWYIAPTYRQAKQIAWDILKGYVIEQNIVKKKNESELSITLINGSKIELKGADNEDSLRGVGLDHSILDEFATMKPNVWSEVIRPALADKKGSSTFIGTPQGFNQFYDIYNMQDASGDYKSWRFKTTESYFIDPHEVEQARKELDERTFRQEFEASFENSTGRVYYTFDRKTHNTQQEYETQRDCILTVDFNIDPCCWTIWHRIDGIDYAVNEISLRNTNTVEMSRTLIEKFPNKKYIVYGDYAGNQRRTSSTGTDYDIMKQIIPNLELRLEPPPAIVDSVNAFNSRLKNINNDIKVFVNINKCKSLVKDLEQVCWKDGTKDIDKRYKELTHSSDGARYMMNYEYSLKGKIKLEKRGYL
jgi:hypothetical protein